MLYKEIVTSIYSEFLGKAIKNHLTTAHIFQNQIGYDEFDGTVVLLSETSAGEILKGKRNMSYNAMLAFQATLNYQTPKKLFLQDDFFKIQLLSRLTTLILNDSSFSYSKKNLNNGSSSLFILYYFLVTSFVSQAC